MQIGISSQGSQFIICNAIIANERGISEADVLAERIRDHRRLGLHQQCHVSEEPAS